MRDLNSILLEGRAKVATVNRSYGVVDAVDLMVQSDEVTIMVRVTGKLAKRTNDTIGFDGAARGVRIVGRLQQKAGSIDEAPLNRGVEIVAEHIEFRLVPEETKQVRRYSDDPRSVYR